MASMFTDVVTGAVFGSALTASGVYQPSVIMSQMQLRNYHMLQVFLGASAASALLVRLASRLDYCPLQPRGPSPLGRMNPYTGNIVGGLLIGIGVAVTGACPGTAIVQGALGVPSGLYVCGGGLLGGVMFVKLAPILRRTFPESAAITSKAPAGELTPVSNTSGSKQAHTVHEKYGYHVNTVLLIYETICLLMIGVTTKFAPRKGAIFNPVFGGLFIGVAQAFSILLSRKTLGVSTAYEQMGQAFWELVQPCNQNAPASYAAVRFAVGILLGSKTLAMYKPELASVGEIQNLPRLAAVTGGAIMVFGARLAGGCTSGHGISGMATMSIASFLTVGAMFAGGIGWSFLVTR